MKPTERLSAEHRVIEKGLDALDGMAQRVAGGGELVVKDAQTLIAFLRRYADKRHHGKEENQLFTRLVEMGWSREFGPIAVMLSEHEQGRALVRQMDECLTQKKKEGFAEAAVQFTALLRQHIHKEDNILYPMADQAFSDDDQQALSARFDKVDNDLSRGEDPAAFVKDAERLSAAYPCEQEESCAPSQCFGGCSH